MPAVEGSGRPTCDLPEAKRDKCFRKRGKESVQLKGGRSWGQRRAAAFSKGGDIGNSVPRGRETRSQLGASGGVTGAVMEKDGPLCSDILPWRKSDERLAPGERWEAEREVACVCRWWRILRWETLEHLMACP